MKSFLTKIILLFFLLPFIIINPLQAAAEQRIVLVIGNSAYSSGPLNNPVNDATDIVPPEAKKSTTLAMGKRPSVSTGNEIRRDGRFIAYDNGTVLDTSTNLMWASRDNGSDINWQSAKSYCENYRGGGYTDWRMPMHDELAGLYDSNKSYKATQRNYNVCLTEMIQISSCCPWAAEARGSDAAYFGFGGGARYWAPQSSGKGYRALPVRSAK